MNIFEEILWPQFVQFEHIKRLPLNEQVKHYNQYLYELTIARQNWITYQNKGDVAEVEEGNFLLQEDLFYILQEDNSKIIIT
jgi:hypothetical protein